jgi:hypothetical protein
VEHILTPKEERDKESGYFYRPRWDYAPTASSSFTTTTTATGHRLLLTGSVEASRLWTKASTSFCLDVRKR